MHFNFIKLCIQKSLWFHFGTKLWSLRSGVVVHKQHYSVRELRVPLHRGGWPSYPKGKSSAPRCPLALHHPLLTFTLSCSASCQTPPVQFTKPVVRAGPRETGLRAGRGGRGGGGINHLLLDVLLFVLSPRQVHHDGNWTCWVRVSLRGAFFF